MVNIKNIITKFFTQGHARTLKAKKNIIASLFIKGMSIVIGFLMVRITLDYLDKTNYGIWLTISSFLTWFTFFEVGLGSGLKNKLAESLASKDYKLGKIYVSTTYAILSIIVLVVYSLFIIINQFLDWSVILNTDRSLSKELNLLALIVFSFFFLRFVIKLIGVVLQADQRPAISNMFGPIGNLISLIVIYILTKTTDSSLIYIGFTLSVVPVVVLIIASIYFYNSDYKKIAPSIKFIQFKYAKDLLHLGVKFFLIQISALVLFQTSNIIISQFFGPAEVTPYNIAYKYFSMVNMLFTIIITPFWAAFTEAWVKKDINWIKNQINKLIMIWGLLALLSIIMLIFSEQFFNVWIGEENMKTISIPFILKLFLVIYFLSFTFGGVFNMFINGVSKIKLQGYILLGGAFLFVPLVLLFIKVFHWGIESVVIASIIANIYSPLIAPIQYYKLINNKAVGIWNE